MIPAADWAVIAGLTAACAGVALVAGLLLMRLLRSRSVVSLLLVTSCAPVATVTGAVLVTTWAMFLSEHDSRVVLVGVALSMVSAVGVALVLGWSVRRSARTLAASAVLVGESTYGASRPVATKELRTVALALDDGHRRLTRARAVAEATEHSRRQLVAGMSHDLRTPLAGMRAMVESLEDGVVVDKTTVERYHRQLRVEIDRIAQMVNDLFELSRVEGPMQLHLERVGADDLVVEALATADPVARAKGIRLVARTSPGLPVAVDPDEFGRVMRNLLLNAIRHTPSDGTIAVSAMGLAPDDAVSFTVADGCGGIPDEDLPRVFETAFRGNAARTPGPDHGGGFGLAIARSIVEAHRGVIEVANHGRGCRFEVRLPLAPD